MSRTVEIRLSKDPSKLRIQHFNVIKEPLLETNDLKAKVNIVHLYTGLLPSTIRTFPLDEINAMVNTICAQFGKMQIKEEPPKEINLNGTTYELVNPKKIGIGWHIDFANCNMDQDPVKLACMFYHPKGIKYGEVDDNGNMISTTSDRRLDVEFHMQLSTFMEASAFFLKQYERSTRIYTAKERSKNWMETILMKLRINNQSLTSGKK